jgi:hypothetical protein
MNATKLTARRVIAGFPISYLSMVESTRRTFVVGMGSAVAAGVLMPARLLEAKMIEPTTITEQLMYSTARIVGLNSNGAPFKTGTGFFYQFPVAAGDPRNVPILVTNKHVVEGVAQAEFVIHTNSTGGLKPDGNGGVRSQFADWVPHPNPKVDLCALPVGGVLNQAKAFFRALDPSIVPSEAQLEQLSAVEDVLMIGYPNGLWDAANNYPLIRRGITASHPAVDFEVDGAATTVVDAACFPGSSGSPVILYNVGTYGDKKGNTVIGSRVMLLGVLFSGPLIQADGKIVIRNIPTAVEPIAQVNMMMNLGYIVKARELAALGAAVLAKIGPTPGRIQ